MTIIVFIYLSDQALMWRYINKLATAFMISDGNARNQSGADATELAMLALLNRQIFGHSIGTALKRLKMASNANSAHDKRVSSCG